MNTVIFDFNGTLFWDSPYHNEAFLEQVRLHSGDGAVPGAPKARHITVQDIREHIMGRTNDQIMRFIFGESITDAEVDVLARESHSHPSFSAIALAAWRPAPMARITVAAPLTASPPA